MEKTISVSSMSWNPEGNGASADSLPTYKVLNYGDMAFEGNRTKGHSYGKLVINDIGTGIMSSRFRTLRPVSEVCVPFWKYYLQDSDAWKPLFIRSTKRGTLMTELVPDELLNGAIYLPDMPEQVAIGSLFTHLDSFITLHQRKQGNVWHRNGAWNGLTNSLVFRTPLAASSPSCTPTVARMDASDGADRVAAGSVPMAQTFVCAPGDASAAASSERPFSLRGDAPRPWG